VTVSEIDEEVVGLSFGALEALALFVSVAQRKIPPIVIRTPDHCLLRFLEIHRALACVLRCA
jgi:hypothetical protein